MSFRDLPIAPRKAELFKALGHPVRIQVLEQLVDGEQSVSTLSDQLESPVSNLSQQLSVLRQAGVVQTRREGTTIYYALRDEHMADLLRVAKEIVLTELRDSSELLRELDASAQ